jgi:hypothetical protein
MEFKRLMVREGVLELYVMNVSVNRQQIELHRKTPKADHEPEGADDA